MPSDVVVWDLNTVPHLGSYARANNLIGKSPAEIRAAMGDEFPKLIYHSIICIGALVATRTSNGWEVQAVGAPHVGQRPEKELIPLALARPKRALGQNAPNFVSKRLACIRLRKKFDTSVEPTTMHDGVFGIS